MDSKIEVMTLEAILSTLDEVYGALEKKHLLTKHATGSWLLRAAGIMDSMEVVKAMRRKVIIDVLRLKAEAELARQPKADLPPGLTVLTPEEVASRESKPISTEA